MKRLIIALSTAAVLIASAPAWAHGQGRGHQGSGPGVRHGHHVQPQHHGRFAHRPHFAPGHYDVRVHVPGHGPRVFIAPGHGWYARPHHGHRFRGWY